MANDPPVPSGTVPEDPPPSWLRMEQRIRFVSISFMTLVVVAAGVGLLGVWTGTASATESGYTVEVEHARVSRGGLPTPFAIRVLSDAGDLPEAITIRVDNAYMAIFDENGLDPTPVSTFADDRHIWWTFEVPPGRQHLTVEFDGRIEPSAQWGKSATVALVDGDEVIVSVDYTTVVVP